MYQLVHVKRWQSTEKSVTIDFGDHADAFLILNTPQARDLASLVAGYIEIRMHARQGIYLFQN